MDSAKIKSFLFLSVFLSYTKTGDALNISQSVLSRHIKSLEEELGFELFNRNSKFVSLTPAGVIMAEGLRDIKNRYDILIEQASLSQNGYTGEIRIGIMDGLLLSGFRQVKTAYELLHPDIKFVFISKNLGRLRAMLFDKSLDFVLGIKHDFDFISKFTCKTICQNPIGLVISEKHRLADRDGAMPHLVDFKDETFFVIHENESMAIRTLIKVCGTAGFWPKVVTVPNLPSVILQIDAGYGAAICSEGNISFGNPNLKYLHLPEFDSIPLSEYAIVWLNENEKTNNRALINYLNENAS